MVRSFRTHWFLWLLALTLLTGFTIPAPLASLADARTLRQWIIAAVLFATILPLDMAAFGHALTRPTAPILAVLVNYGLVPLVAWPLSRLLPGELSTGLVIAAAVPSTVASAAVWTRRAGGNEVIALIVTVVTNFLCFLVTPFWVLVATGRSGANISLPEMVAKLAFIVVLPMALAQIARRRAVVSEFAARRRHGLAVFSQLGILVVVLMGAVQCGLKLGALPDQDSRLGHFGLMVALVVVLHSIALFAGQAVGRLSGLSRSDWIAVGFAGSQKTLMVGLHVALLLGGGLTILPMVAYHAAQLLIDTVVADRLAGERP